jgi:hypothetical protein
LASIERVFPCRGRLSKKIGILGQQDPLINFFGQNFFPDFYLFCLLWERVGGKPQGLTKYCLPHIVGLIVPYKTTENVDLSGWGYTLANFLKFGPNFCLSRVLPNNFCSCE